MLSLKRSSSSSNSNNEIKQERFILLLLFEMMYVVAWYFSAVKFVLNYDIAFCIMVIIMVNLV